MHTVRSSRIRAIKKFCRLLSQCREILFILCILPFSFKSIHCNRLACSACIYPLILFLKCYSLITARIPLWDACILYSRLSNSYLLARSAPGPCSQFALLLFPFFSCSSFNHTSTSPLSSCHVFHCSCLSGPSHPESSRPILRSRNNHLYSRRDSCSVASLGEKADENQTMGR